MTRVSARRGQWDHGARRPLTPRTLPLGRGQTQDLHATGKAPHKVRWAAAAIPDCLDPTKRAAQDSWQRGTLPPATEKATPGTHKTTSIY